jgi:hypothetical protein
MISGGLTSMRRPATNSSDDAGHTRMTREAIHEDSRLPPSSMGAGDPELARICELGQVMTLSPTELIAKLKSDSPKAGSADHNSQDGSGGDLPQDVAGIPALANLASIATTLQRNPLPPLRIGHATALPAPASAPTLSPSSADDEAIPSLSAWHGPTSDDQDQWAGRQLYAAGLGLLAGLALVAGTLLWLGGWFDTSYRPKVREPAPTIEKPARIGEGAIPRSPAARPELAGRDDIIRPNLSDVRRLSEVPAAPVTTPKPSPERLVQEAARRIERGDVSGARDLLAGAGNDPQGLVPFTLAETYDPNMLAAWGTRDVAPDIEKARGLYSEALSLGYAASRQRLDLLK